jgi:CRP/FNR family transcriptional regulator, cyclic AMP receptor protein
MAETRKLIKDEYLFKEGDFPDNMYIVRSGGLAITKTKNKSEVVLAEIGTGAMVGEMALFDKKPRSANVKATKETEVVCLPYKGLEQQLASMPEWLRAIIKTLNQNLREANLKIKTLGETQVQEESFPPQLINRLISIINLVSMQYGKKEDKGLSVPPGTLRKYTIQIFQQPTHKMTTLLSALEKLKYFEIIDLEDSKQILYNKKPEMLKDFVEWHNDWLMKPEESRFDLHPQEVKTLKGIVHFAKKGTSTSNGKMKINIEQVMTSSKAELDFVIRPDDFNGLISKGLCSEKVVSAQGVMVEVLPDDLEKIATNFGFIQELAPLLAASGG